MGTSPTTGGLGKKDLVNILLRVLRIGSWSNSALGFGKWATSLDFSDSATGLMAREEVVTFDE